MVSDQSKRQEFYASFRKIDAETSKNWRAEYDVLATAYNANLKARGTGYEVIPHDGPKAKLSDIIRLSLMKFRNPEFAKMGRSVIERQQQDPDVNLDEEAAITGFMNGWYKLKFSTNHNISLGSSSTSLFYCLIKNEFAADDYLAMEYQTMNGRLAQQIENDLQ